MREQHAQCQLLLARGRDPGPDLAHRAIERELAALDQREHEHRGDALAHGVDVHQRVALPRLGAARIAMPAPEVDHHAPTDPHAQRGTEIIADTEILAERVRHVRESGIANTRDGHIGAADCFAVRMIRHRGLVCGHATPHRGIVPTLATAQAAAASASLRRAIVCLERLIAEA